MKSKIKSILITTLGAVCIGIFLTLFQNCSQTGEITTRNGTTSAKTEVALASDDRNISLPVTSIDTSDLMGDKDKGGKHQGDCEKDCEKDCDHDDDETAQILADACKLDSKSIHSLIDVAQFANKDISLDLIKGKTLIYSSDEKYVIKSLNIDAAVGRTILCGLKVDKLSLKKGRLEVYRTEIEEIGEQRGILIKDQYSKLPAGY